MTRDISSIKVISEPVDVSKQAFMLRYIMSLANCSSTPDLRSQWTIVYKYISKQISGVRKI